MKLLLSPKTIISGFLSTAVGFAGTTAIALSLFSAPTVNAQTKLYSVPEINWSTRLSSFELDRQDFGRVFTFSCPAAPPTQVYAPVWGTNTYTVNSGLCKAAVHAGMITKDGGLINVQLNAGESAYQGSDRFSLSIR